MSTDTTRVSSYVRAEGFYDSAGTMYQYASAVNNLVSGLTASANYTAMNRVFSGLTASCVATQINNLFSGLASTVSAGMITGYTLRAATADAATTALAATTSLAAASASYAASAGTLSGVSATPAQLNTLLYGTKYKVAFGSTVATDAVVMTSVTNCGLSTALYVFVNPQVTGIIAAGLATQTGVKWNIVNSTGVATQATCDYMIVGNA